jgi:hypothetical protein
VGEELRRNNYKSTTHDLRVWEVVADSAPGHWAAPPRTNNLSYLTLKVVDRAVVALYIAIGYCLQPAN